MGLNVVVVGAGPAGLCTALALAQDGNDVTVLERRPGTGLSPNGGILMIQHAACRAVGHVEGMSKALASVDAGDDWASWWSYKNAHEPIATRRTQKGHVERWQVERPSVQRVLLELAQDKGIRILTGKEVVRILDDGSKATVWTDDGIEFSADLIVGADGIKSAVRRLLFPGEDVEPVALRETAHYALVPLDRLEKISALKPWLNKATFYMVWGPQRFCVFRQVYDGKVGMLLFDTDYGDPLPVDGQWNSLGDMNELRERFADFSPLLQSYLDQVEQVERWQIAHLKPLKTWRSDGGRIVLVGDAAHAMVPHVAQGLSQGFEDAIALARILRGWPELGVPNITDAWMQLRKPRAERFQEVSLIRTNMVSLPDGPEQEARDARIRQQGEMATETNWDEIEADPSAHFTSKPYIKWATMYDVVAEADGVLSGLRTVNKRDI